MDKREASLRAQKPIGAKVMHLPPPTPEELRQAFLRLQAYVLKLEARIEALEAK